MNHDTFDSLGASRIDATWGDVCLKSCVGREHIKTTNVHRPLTYVRGQGEKGEGGGSRSVLNRFKHVFRALQECHTHMCKYAYAEGKMGEELGKPEGGGGGENLGASKTALGRVGRALRASWRVLGASWAVVGNI
jgi:hypothetical protein